MGGYDDVCEIDDVSAECVRTLIEGDGRFMVGVCEDCTASNGDVEKIFIASEWKSEWKRWRVWDWEHVFEEG